MIKYNSKKEDIAVFGHLLETKYEKELLTERESAENIKSNYLCVRYFFKKLPQSLDTLKNFDDSPYNSAYENYRLCLEKVLLDYLKNCSLKEPTSCHHLDWLWKFLITAKKLTN